MPIDFGFEHLVRSFQLVFALAVFRLFPFFVYVLTCNYISALIKLLYGSIFLFLAVFAYADRLIEVYTVLGGYGYYAFVCLGVFLFSRRTSQIMATRAAVFIGCAVLFLVVPAAVVRNIPVSIILIIGWDLMLSSYSYCVDTQKLHTRPSLRDCLFFLLVNPTLVYAERGQPINGPKFGFRALLRIALGLMAFFFVYAILDPSFNNFVSFTKTRHGSSYAGGLFFIFVTLTVVKTYILHSGLASFQIGLMRQIGYKIPERYHYPFLATDPLDFWRRWNIYVAAWIRRYIFFPLAVNKIWRRNLLNPALGKSLSVIAAFVFVGLLHDGLQYLSALRFSSIFTQGFVISGFLVLVWVGAGQLLLVKKIRKTKWGKISTRLFSRIAFWATLYAIIAHSI